MTCTTGKVCAKFNEKGDAKCFDVPQVAPIIFDLPFDNATEVVCAQSGRFSNATHIYRNMLYAIDLATPDHKSPSIIRASADGKAFVINECSDLSGSPQQTKTDSCGGGYGNHVRILHADGYMSLYAHLTIVKVKDGEMVKKHQILATEGATGQAAYRHLHWDVHKIEGAKESWEKQLANPAWGGYSVPFKFEVNINRTEKIIDSSAIACRWLDMKQPVWRGTYKP
jgi:murein DD-endopeptidase MepM/ murein hydrolase activator NlpD